MNYSEKLRDPRWQKKRLEILNRDNFTCRQCGDSKSTLHVHHAVYHKGKDPWDYDECFLSTLCHDCHDFAGTELTVLEKFILECLMVRDGEAGMSSLKNAVRGYKDGTRSLSEYLTFFNK